MTSPGTPATAPSGWGLTDAEIERLVADSIGEPDPADNEWRPEGGSLLGGIGQCLYDEIRAIIDLTRLIWELNNDLDLAVDGEDNWEIRRNRGVELGQLAVLYSQLSDGTQSFGDLPAAQQQSLFRFYAKSELIKATLATMGEAGLGLLAAYDVHWSEYDLWTLNQGENLLKGLADAVSLMFDDAEWQALAETGQAIAEQVNALIEERLNTDPWGTAGYAACLVALFVSPTKVLRALRGLSTALRGLGSATDVASLSRILRAQNVPVPAWLGGADDAARAANRAEDAVPDELAGAGNRRPDVVDEDAPHLDSDNANPEVTVDPGADETPDAGPNTTHVPRSQRIGNMAEADARARLEADGFQTFELKNGSGHGPDIIAVNPDTGQVRVIEVKANSSTLNALQQQGGPAYLQNVFGRIDGLEGGGSWNTRAFDDFLEDVGIESREELLSGDFEVWRYRGVDPDNPASVSGGPQTTSWTPGTTGREFRLDANGNVETRRGPNREWTPYVEPGDHTN